MKQKTDGRQAEPPCHCCCRFVFLHCLLLVIIRNVFAEQMQKENREESLLRNNEQRAEQRMERTEFRYMGMILFSLSRFVFPPVGRIGLSDPHRH